MTNTSVNYRSINIENHQCKAAVERRSPDSLAIRPVHNDSTIDTDLQCKQTCQLPPKFCLRQHRDFSKLQELPTHNPTYQKIPRNYFEPSLRFTPSLFWKGIKVDNRSFTKIPTSVLPKRYLGKILQVNQLVDFLPGRNTRPPLSMYRISKILKVKLLTQVLTNTVMLSKGYKIHLIYAM